MLNRWGAKSRLAGTLARTLKILLLILALGVTFFGLRQVKSAPTSGKAPRRVVLTVMGKVADTGQPGDQKAFKEFAVKTGIQIRFAQSLQTANEQIDLFTGLLRAHSPDPDLIDMDVIWPATLGRDLLDLKPYFQDEIRDFAPELIRNFTVNGRLIAMPTFVNAGVLYYRPDLLKKYGFTAPPTTWEELERMAWRIQTGERRAGKTDFWGYLWQGGRYESLTCNALEWQSSSGAGEILGANGTVHVRDARFVHALNRAVSWIGTLSPRGQTALGEADGVNFWLDGKAAFMRSWTGEYPDIVSSSSVVGRHTAIAAMPGGPGGRRGTLGGSGTGVSIYSAHPKQALQALRFIVSENTQRDRAITGGYIPSRLALRRSPEVMAKTPLQGSTATTVIENLAARPALQAGPSYNLVSRAYYTAIHSILTKQTTPEQGLATLEAELVKITGFHPVP